MNFSVRGNGGRLNNTSNNSEDIYIHIGSQSAVHLHKQAGGALTPEYLHNNLLGSALVGTDASGSSKWQQQYKPFGSELMSNTGRSNTHLGYTGKPHDANTGLSYYGARYYSPSIGRFLSMDPAPVDASSPMSFNRYAYANDNPYRYTDPTGKEAKADAGAEASGSAASGNGNVAGDAAGKGSVPDSSVNSDDDTNKKIDHASSTVSAAVMVGAILGDIEDGPGGAIEDNAVGDSVAVKEMSSEGSSLSSEGRDALSHSASKIDPADKSGQLTRAGRALQKHGSRPDSNFSKATGNPASINEQGQQVVDGILNDSGASVSENRFGGLDIKSSGGNGVRFDGNGEMMGLLNP